MLLLKRKLPGLLGGAAMAVTLLLSTPGGVAADGATTCSGGPVAAGTYSSLAIAGVCAVNAGNVRVDGNLNVLPGGVLVAAFSGSDLSIGGNLIVEAGAILVLGCEPRAFPCLNDPNARTGGTLFTSDTIGGNLTAEDSLAVLVHHNSIGRNVALTGGGGGVSCNPNPLLSSLAGFPAPPFATFEDNRIGGTASITGWRSCWLGFIRDTVSGNVNFNDNVTADPDGNEVTTNTIDGNLNCEGDSPNPQIGDSRGSLNTVFGRATGQCSGLAA
jgi:hypothetical protein